MYDSGFMSLKGDQELTKEKTDTKPSKNAKSDEQETTFWDSEHILFFSS